MFLYICVFVCRGEAIAVPFVAPAIWIDAPLHVQIGCTGFLCISILSAVLGFGTCQEFVYPESLNAVSDFLLYEMGWKFSPLHVFI